MFELIKQLIQSWAVAWIRQKITRLEAKLDKHREKLHKKVNKEETIEYYDEN